MTSTRSGSSCKRVSDRVALTITSSWTSGTSAGSGAAGRARRRRRGRSRGCGLHRRRLREQQRGQEPGEERHQADRTRSRRINPRKAAVDRPRAGRATTTSGTRRSAARSASRRRSKPRVRGGFSAVAPDRLLDRRRRAVVQERPAEPQTPQRRRADFVGRRPCDAVAGADVVQQQVRKQRDGRRSNSRLRLAAGRQRRHVARRTADRREHCSPARGRVAGAARERRQEPHEAREVVDAAAARPGIADVFRIGNRIADPHPIRGDADGQFVGNRSFVMPISLR